MKLRIAASSEKLSRGDMRTRPLELVKAQPQLSAWELFWESYPKKRSKGDAYKAWTQTEKERPPIEEILGALENAMRTHDWQRDGGQYIPYPASWLRAWGWADE